MVLKKTSITLAIGITLLITACSNTAVKNSTPEVISTTKSEEKLPIGFTLAKINSAIEEYINYRLWFFPSKVAGNTSEFDSFIDQSIEGEVRLYESSPEVVYVSINKGERLAVLKLDKGFVYCDGFLEKDSTQWPKGTYVIIDKIIVKVKQPHKPNYGTSPLKDKMINAIESQIKKSLKDLSSGEDGDKWNNTTIYLVDFYEYERGVNIWYVREDGYVWHAPMLLVEKNNGFEAENLKGYELKNAFTLDKYDPGRYMFEKQTNDAIKKFTWKNGQLVTS